MYSITTKDEHQMPVYVTSGAILSLLAKDESQTAADHEAAINQLEREGTRYSNQDFDILSAALAYIRKRDA